MRTKPHNPAAVNLVVYRSIPLNQRFKRYWIRKFQRMVLNSGRKEAERKFKHLKEVVLRYISDPFRHKCIEKYYLDSGFRRNSFLKMLFVYADCQPHYALDLIKLYSYSEKEKNIPQWGRPNSPWNVAKQTKERLEAIDVDTHVPKPLADWIDVFRMSRRQRSKLYDRLVSDVRVALLGSALGIDTRKPERYPGDSFSQYCRHHSKEEWEKYWNTQIGIMHEAWTKSIDLSSVKVMYPDVYKDFDERSRSSISLDLDYDNLAQWCRIIGRGGDDLRMREEDERDAVPFTREELEFIISFLSEELQDNLKGLLDPPKTGAWRCLIPELQGPRSLDPKKSRYPIDICRGRYVGHIHHIAKKGAGLELRDIAVPIRFVQCALHPCWMRVRCFQELLPQDASLDQSKFDQKITSRVSNPNLYVGTVDLSKATDSFPRDWCWLVVDAMVEKWGWNSDVEQRSFDLFRRVSSSLWEDQGFLSSWKVGQPLGTEPSFGFFSLGHRTFMESMSLASGLGHSPYALVGDDTVFFNKKLRGKYIHVLTSHRIPLSLHKSYDGRLAEFAGKTYVANCVPFFTTDHALLTWESLFDYQIATGVKIPYQNLPQKLRKKWKGRCRRYDPEGYTSLVPNKTYSLALDLLVPDRGSSRSTKLIEEAQREGFEYYMYTTPFAREHRQPGPFWFHGLVNLAGHPVRLLDSRFADKDGWFERYRPIQLPPWYEKYRKVSTDLALEASCFAVSDHKDSLADNCYFEPYGKNW